MNARFVTGISWPYVLGRPVAASGLALSGGIRAALAQALQRTLGIVLVGSLAMISLGGRADANIIYTVEITAPSGTESFTVCVPSPFGNQCTTETINFGPETLTGTITTDGRIGSLAASDFVEWSLSGTGSIPFVVFSSLGLFGSTSFDSCGSGGCGVTASVTELDFTGGASTGVAFSTQFNSFGGPIPTNELSFTPGAFEILVSDGVTFPLAPTFQLPADSYTIATAGTSTPPGGGSVPEPGSLALSALPLAVIALIHSRRQRLAKARGRHGGRRQGCCIR